MQNNTTGVTTSCHCGAVQLRLPAPPARVNHCNCSLCRSYGVLWAYYALSEIGIGRGQTDTYAWNGRNVDFHRCHTCGCVTHWLPRDPQRDRVGVNVRLLDPFILDKAEIYREDYGGTGLFH